MIFLSLLLGVLPGFAWLYFYLGEETHPEPEKLIAFTFIAGIAFGFFTVAIETGFTTFMANFGFVQLSIVSLIGLAFIEEFMKFTAAYFAINKNAAFNEPVDAMIFMIVAALGFATLENIGAIASITQPAAFFPAIFETVSLRFVGATLLHTLTSGIVGYYWALGCVYGKTKRYLIVGFAIATLLHASFNYLIVHYGNGSYAVLFLVVIGFFVLCDFESLKINVNINNL